MFSSRAQSALGSNGDGAFAVRRSADCRPSFPLRRRNREEDTEAAKIDHERGRYGLKVDFRSADVAGLAQSDAHEMRQAPFDHGPQGKQRLHTPAMIRFGDLTEDEVFVGHEAARDGVVFDNNGTEPLVTLRYFGPDTNPTGPSVGDHKRQR